MPDAPIPLSGLTTAEANTRLLKFGPNSVSSKAKLRPIVAFVKKFNSPLLIILMGASVISFFTGNQTSAIILICMVFLSVILDFVNTFRSEKAVDALIARVITTATVIRDGKRQEVNLTTIVPGDLVFLSAGDVIPADCRVMDGNDFFVNQSVMTGESLPVEKSHLQQSSKEEINAEASDIVLMGTSVVTGYATVEALRTGKQTEFGKIAERLTEADPETDFDRGIRKFSSFIMKLTIIMVVFVFAANTISGRGFLESFVFAIAIAVGLTPELLPVIMSVSLSRGAVRMAKTGVIVKHLPAIQNFGRMSVLCTDKTGTLTENRIVVVQFVDTYGKVTEDVLRYAYYNSAFHTGVPNPLDQAVRDFKKWDVGQLTKIDEVPFDFERRRESVVVDEGAKRLLITKGAPEAVYGICESYLHDGQLHPADDAFHTQAQAEFTRLSQEGFKVLAVCFRDVPKRLGTYEKNEEQGMTFLGYVAFMDPAKETVKETLDELELLGVEIKILTGDNELLTQKVCRDIQLVVKGTITGEQIRKLSTLEFRKVVSATTIFARITPEQKERIIRTLQDVGHVVGYLGDGINDAPALKAADVGVSVNNAVDVAKETADIILLKKSLRVLKAGIIEGRKTFRNTLKYILMGMSSNFGNMFSMMVASAFLPFLPMLPTQVLLNNFLYDTSQLSLSSDHVDESDVVKPTGWDMKFIRKYMLVFGPISSLFDFATFGLMFMLFRNSEHQFQTGWFMESIATQVFVIYIIRTKKIPFLQSSPSRLLLFNTLLIVTIAWLMPLLPFARFFNLQPLPLWVVGTLFSFVILYLLLVEVVKRWFFRREAKLALVTTS
ncbi:MAG: magnesium-translocating P-type ATPase [Patescibacteria group bacterium]